MTVPPANSPHDPPSRGTDLGRPQGASSGVGVEAAELARLTDDLVAAVQAVPGVHGLHGGMFGESATYLPGRRVAGIRRTDEGTEVHVTLLYGYPVRETANAVRLAVAAIVPGPVHVTIEDVVPAGPEDSS